MNHDALALPDAPRLREGLEAYRDDDPSFTVLVDPLRLAREPLRLTRRELTWASLMTGRRTLRDLQDMIIRSGGGVFVTLEEIARLVDQLDAGYYLDSPPSPPRTPAPRAPRPQGRARPRLHRLLPPGAGRHPQAVRRAVHPLRRPRPARRSEPRPGAARRAGPAHGLRPRQRHLRLGL